MKLAKEIEAALDECELLPCLEDDERDNVIAIISAKLGPVEDVLKEISNATEEKHSIGGSALAGFMRLRARNVLALFDEE